MKRTWYKIGRPKGARTAYPGICKLAKKLGISTYHLREVLDGRRNSPPILAKIEKLALAKTNPPKKSPNQ